MYYFGKITVLPFFRKNEIFSGFTSLICSPSFIRLHSIRCQENPSYIVHHYRSVNKIHLLTKIDEETTQILPGSNIFYFECMICSFNGLVYCIKNHTRHVCVCDLVDIYGMEHLSINIYNPATQRFLSLPSTFVLECPIHNNLSTIGVSFLPTING